MYDEIERYIQEPKKRVLAIGIDGHQLMGVIGYGKCYIFDDHDGKNRFTWKEKPWHQAGQRQLPRDVYLMTP